MSTQTVAVSTVDEQASGAAGAQEPQATLDVAPACPPCNPPGNGDPPIPPKY